MSAQPEMWRVSTIEGVFETDLETLKQWVVEGCVLPTDKVSKGNLSWIDAGRVPKLKGAFEGVIDIPPASPQADTETNQGGWQVPPNETQAPFETPHETPYSTISPLVSCQNHPGVEPKYVCRACATMLCAECPRFVGTSKIAVCPFCGDLCHSYTEIKTKTARAEFQSSGFGFSDFLTAVQYPWKHKTALIGGAFLYGLLLLTGFRGSLFAWMIMFGCISHVISQVAWVVSIAALCPTLVEFSFIEDLVQPLFLGLGITLVSWGPVIVLVLALVLGVVSGGPPATQESQWSIARRRTSRSV